LRLISQVIVIKDDSLELIQIREGLVRFADHRRLGDSSCYSVAIQPL